MLALIARLQREVKRSHSSQRAQIDPLPRFIQSPGVGIFAPVIGQITVTIKASNILLIYKFILMDYFISSASVSTLVEGRFDRITHRVCFPPTGEMKKNDFSNTFGLRSAAIHLLYKLLRLSKKKETPPSNHFAGGAIPYGSRDLTNKLSYTCYKIYFTIFTL